jgi:radical SAM superfamily enzyme YgiQ (UPF0313 family)
MHLIHFVIDNACHNGFREIDFKLDPDRISKWRLLPSGKEGLELLRLITGGSGVSLTLRLPPEIESLPPDYSLYPELGKCAIGFLTRGCPFNCAFCVVPIKEGRTIRFPAWIN